MPRQARIDAPGALQHIIVRGIERQPIFKNEADQQDFVDRLGKLLQDSQTSCYAWALVTNHVHLLLRTGRVPVSKVMRRLLTGYAISFNRRHYRHGHLFQNRFKSILCEEDAYFKQLVAYIHLNPYRAGIAETFQALSHYPFSGHCALMGESDIFWQDVDYVLAVFGKNVSSARNRYFDYVSKWALAGRRPELTGGGLIRSAGGWIAVKEAYKQGIRLTSDERILGSSDFVRKVLTNAGEDYDRKMWLKASGIDLEAVMDVVNTHLHISLEELIGPGRKPPISRARALISYLAVWELEISGAAVARRMRVDRSSISRSIDRVQRDQGLKKLANELLCKLHPEDCNIR